jgi:predicted RND superfamily exporter protein
VRVYESDPGLDRSALLERIRTELTSRFGLQPRQVHVTGLMVLYNNVLQSLFRSQAMTLGFVLGATALMFAVLFRSIRLALLALVPNLLVALGVLGTMGALGISLDIMTITIAAIVLGIAVDDSIHYVHRWQEELQSDGDARAAVRRAHANVGRAMLYTSVTIALGFSLFALSAFKPIAYFGLLTGLAMLAALLANLTLLPALLVLAETARPITRRS